VEDVDGSVDGDLRGQRGGGGVLEVYVEHGGCLGCAVDAVDVSWRCGEGVDVTLVTV